MGTCMASCVVLVVVGNGRQGEGEGTCGLGVVVSGICKASCMVVVVVSGRLV